MTNCYLNGEFFPLAEARISPLDRGFLFGDGVYEVIPVYRGKLFALPQHLVRLRRSLAKIRLPFFSAGGVGELRGAMEKLAAAAGDTERAALYAQITRGAAAGRTQKPPSEISPTVFMFCNAAPPVPDDLLQNGAQCITAEDYRWRRGDIKSVSLLAAVLFAGEAAERGAYETILLREGILTEGGSCNFFAVKNEKIFAPKPNADILAGITMRLVLQTARRLGIAVERRDIRRPELFAADEILLTSSLREILPVTTVDGAPIGNGGPGKIFARLAAAWKKKTGMC